MVKNENTEKLKSLAKEVMDMARNSAVVNLRFIDCAVNRLKYKLYEGSIATDGQYIYYDFLYVLREYKAESTKTARFFLHLLFHCIFRHCFINSLIDRDLWNLSCDIAVENILNELDIRAASISSVPAQKVEIERLKKHVNILTAEKIYSYYRDGGIPSEETERLKELFSPDDHSLWYKTENPDFFLEATSGISGSLESKNGASDGCAQGLMQEWKEISEKIQTDLQTFSKAHGNAAGSLVQNLAALNREKYDYTEFLKKFADLHEAMRINTDEFDYNFYTYGLTLYKNMPLIEPLEYKDVRRIREFVVAIDTSGSVSGELVQTFLNKTYNILKQTESFHSKINLHIIQCDAEIQEDSKITSQNDMDRYFKDMQLRGFGGTDFRPVFRYVDDLIKNGEFSNLKGLIYFTDGFGTYPSHQPQYKTAFIFIDDDYNNPDVPVWAIKLILQSKEV